MTKEEIARILEQIAGLLELKGENPFNIRAYVNAARAIETFGGNTPDMAIGSDSHRSYPVAGYFYCTLTFPPLRGRVEWPGE